MSSCELKQEIAILKREQRDVLIVARNEMVISEMLLSKEPLSKPDELFLKSFLGEKAVIVGTKPDGKNLFSNPYQLAMEIHKANLVGDMDIVQSAAIQLKVAFKSNSELATKLQAVVLNKPDPKYSLVDLSAGSVDILSAVEAIQGDSRIAKRKAKAVAAILEINEKIEDESLSKHDIKFLNEKKLVLQRQGLGADILDSLNANADLLRAESLDGNAYNIFPSVMSVHEAYANKGKDGAGGKTVDDRSKEETDGYVAKKISAFSIDGNTVVSLHNDKDGNSVFSHSKGDEISALSMLLGTTISKSIGATIIDIPDYLKNSIKINAISHMEDIYKTLAYEAGSEEFNKVWDLDVYSDSYNSDIQVISRVHELGGVPQSLILQSLGKAIYKSLPVKFSPEIDKDMEAKAITELGLYALQYMNAVGLTKVENRFVDKAKTAAARDEDANAKYVPTNLFSYNDGKKNQIVIRVNLNQEKDSANFEGLVESSKLVPLISALQYLDVSEDRNIPSSDPITDVQKTIRNSFIDLPKAVHDKILSMQSKPIKFSSDMKAIWQLYKADRNAAYAMAGILEIDTNNSIHDQEKELSKINYSKMQFDEMIAQYEEHWENEFYLPYSYTVSGRYMIDSILNPQESKITRFLVTSSDMESKISVDESTGMYNAVEMQKFKLSVAQAFDLDPDKKMDSEAIADLEKIVSISDNGKIEFKDKEKNPFYKALAQMLKFQKLADAHAEIENNPQSLDEMIAEKLPDFNSIMMDATRAGAGMHTIQALQAIINLQSHSSRSMKTDGKLTAYSSNITIESDAITSGMILTLLGIGTPDALAMAAKGGVYTMDTVNKWKAAVEAFNLAAPDNQFVVLNDSKTGKFKLTHGWLLSFSKHVEKAMDSNPALAEKMAAHDTRFADFYNTVGKDANAGLVSIKAELEEDLNVLKNKYDEASDKDASPEYLTVLAKQMKAIDDKIAMSSFVGEITRKLAKPPVMVYIYGAMLSSIKQKMTDAIVLPKIYDVLNSTSAVVKQVDGEIVSLPMAEMTFDQLKQVLNNKQYVANVVKESAAKAKKKFDAGDKKAYDGLLTLDAVKVLRLMFGDMLVDDGTGETIYNEFGQIEGTDDFVAKRPQFKKFNGIQFVNINNPAEQKLKHLVISPAMANNLKGASEATLGAAFEEGFKQFKEIDDYRESVKTLEVVRFSMFKYHYQKAIDKVVSALEKKDGSYAISSGDVAKIIAELEKSGFGHSVNDINGGKQPLYKKEKLMSDIQAVLDLGSNRITSSSIDGKNYSPNTGASGVITVHNIDGFVDSTSSALFNLIRIYDGSVSGINVLEATGDAYNESTAASTDWSSYNTQANLVSKGIKQMIASGNFDGMVDSLSEVDKDNLINTLEKLMGYKDIEYVDQNDVESKRDGVAKRIEHNMAARFDKDGKPVDVDYLHSYVTDLANPVRIAMNDGKENAINSDSVVTIYEAYGKMLKSLQTYKRFKKYGDETIHGTRAVKTKIFMNKYEYDKYLAQFNDSKSSINDIARARMILGMALTPDMVKEEASSFKKVGTYPPVYLFADNMEHKGSTDSTGMGYTNTDNMIGITVKKKAGKKKDSNFSTEEEINLAIREIDKAFARIPKDREVVYSVKFNKHGVTVDAFGELDIDQRLKSHIKKKIAELKMTNTRQGSHEHVAPESKVESNSDQKEYINHSGGAEGADIAWGRIGEEFGVKSNHYYMGEVGPTNAPYGNSKISIDDEIEGQQKVTLAAREMGRIAPTHQVRDTKLIRNWSQVKYSDQVVAITTMLSVGSEMNYGKKALVRQGKGGTGYAIQMAINEGKPVYVFDQVRKQWFKNIDGKWTNSDVPVLSKNFAGIGTREINEAGKQAIRDAYEKTFSAKITLPPSEALNPKKALGEALDATIPQDKLDQIEDLIKGCKK